MASLRSRAHWRTGSYTQRACSLFFTDKEVSLAFEATIRGRAAWVLDGTQVATVPVVPQLENHWRMWVDKATGIILQLEYYSGSTMIWLG